jgi:CysZ protein
MAGLLQAIALYWDALSMIQRHRLWRFVWIPLIIGLLTGVFLVYLVMHTYEPLGGFVLSWFGSWGEGGWIPVAVEISVLVVWILVAMLLYRYIVLTLSFPFMSFVSATIERILSEGKLTQDPTFNVTGFLRELARGAVISFILFSREIGWVLLLSVVSFVPGIAFLSAPVIFLVQSYFAGASNMDYTLERFMGVRESLHFMKRHKTAAIGNGMVFLLLLTLPVAGIVLAPIIAAAASSIHTLQLLDQETDGTTV